MLVLPVARSVSPEMIWMGAALSAATMPFWRVPVTMTSLSPLRPAESPAASAASAAPAASAARADDAPNMAAATAAAIGEVFFRVDSIFWVSPWLLLNERPAPRQRNRASRCPDQQRHARAFYRYPRGETLSPGLGWMCSCNNSARMWVRGVAT